MSNLDRLRNEYFKQSKEERPKIISEAVLINDKLFVNMNLYHKPFAFI